MNKDSHCGGELSSSQSHFCGGNIEENQTNTYSITHYLSEKEINLVSEELDELQNPYLEGFKPSKRKQSNYLHKGGSKSGNTELRIAGSLLNMLRASHKHSGGCKIAFQLKDIARQIKDDKGNGVSDRTVSRYVSRVLEKLSQIYGIHFEIKKGARGGYLMWTADFQQTIETTGDLFNEKLINKVKRKTDQKKILAWQSRINKHDKTKRSNYLRAKANKLTNGFPKGLAKFARNLSSQIDGEQFSRFQISKNRLFITSWKLLAKGYWRKDVVNIIQSAMRYTDMAISDFTVHNPHGYFNGVLKNLLKKVKIPSQNELKKERVRFWNEEKKKSEEFIQSMGGDMSPEAVEMTNQLYLNKINQCSF